MDASSTFSEKRVGKRKAMDMHPRESTGRDIAGKLGIFIHSTWLPSQMVVMQLDLK